MPALFKGICRAFGKARCRPEVRGGARRLQYRRQDKARAQRYGLRRVLRPHDIGHVRRRKDALKARPSAPRTARPAHSGRAHQPPRHGNAVLARGLFKGLPRRNIHSFARQVLSGPHLHAHRRARKQSSHSLPRQLYQVQGAQGRALRLCIEGVRASTGGEGKAADVYR